MTLWVSLTLGASSLAYGSGLTDPRLRFRTLRTEHFTIHFHDGEDALAARLASFAEDVRREVGASLGVSVPAHTDVILADQSENANGWASPLPRNTVFLNAVAPTGSEFIGLADDWLRLVFTHEYTHIVHLDRSRGWARAARTVLGRNPIAFPNLFLPQWQVEGLATFEESDRLGRLHAGDFREIERTAAASAHPLTLDRASGGLVSWPDGQAAYAAGLGFHDYLARHFGGASKLGELAVATSGRLPFMASGSFNAVYGESLGTLWQHYLRSLHDTPGAGATSTADAVRLTHGRSSTIVGPRFSPGTCESCDAAIVYSARTADGFPTLRTIGADGQGDRALASRYLGSTVGINGDWIVFDQQELRRNSSLYSDLYLLNRSTGRVDPLTRESRLRDPDLSPDGHTLAVVREADGRRELAVTTLTFHQTDATLPVDTLVSQPETQFSAPRWSPDGRSIALERRRLGLLPDVVVVDVARRQIVQEISDASARIVTPAWRPDGRALVVAGDFGGPFDLYEARLSEPQVLRRLTRTAGAIWPDVSPDGHRLTFAGYTADGYELFTAPYRLLNDEARVLRTAESFTVVPPSMPAHPAGSSAYNPLASLGPTSWSPLLAADSDRTLVGGFVAGADVLARHAYALGASWLVAAPDVAGRSSPAVPDWNATYAYARWRPTFFVSASRETTFATETDVQSGTAIPVALVRRELQLGESLPLAHVRRSLQSFGSVVWSERRARLESGDHRITLVSSRLAVGVNTSQQFGYSVSRERGAKLGTTLEASRRAFGSHANATTATVDLRGYLPGVGPHHVMAVRMAGGISVGDQAGRQAFRLGSSSASPSVLDFASNALGLMRSPGYADSGSQIVVGNWEYRVPLATIERGYGTLPLFLKQMHAAAFADVGRVRGSLADPRWRRAAGGELSCDVVAGFGLPVTATLGMAWGRVSGSPGGATVYARIGHSF